MRINYKKTKIKKLLTSILTVCVVSTSLPLAVQVSAHTIENASKQMIQTAEETNYFVINTKEDFTKFMTKSDYYKSNSVVILKSDLNMENVTFKPISKFSGKFDGCGHTISNLKIQDKHKLFKKFDIALIKTLDSAAEFKNVTFDNYTVNDNGSKSILPSSYRASGLIIENYGIISEVNIENGSMNSIANKIGGNASGFVNENFGNIEKCNCSFAGKVELINNKEEISGGVRGGKIAGGFCAKNSGDINSCNFNGLTEANIKTVSDAIAGGFVGENKKGNITNCTSLNKSVDSDEVGSEKVDESTELLAFAKTHSGSAKAGGFVGQNSGGTISNCIVTGNTRSESTLGKAYAGGFVGINKSTIEKSKIIGINSEEIDLTKCCYVYICSGHFYKDNACGGFVGRNDKNGLIDDCYAETIVSTKNDRKVGGFVGEAGNGSTIKNSKCDSNCLVSAGLVKAEFCNSKDKNAVIEDCSAGEETKDEDTKSEETENA